MTVRDMNIYPFDNINRMSFASQGPPRGSLLHRVPSPEQLPSPEIAAFSRTAAFYNIQR